MRYLALALLVLIFLAVAFAGSVGADPPPQAAPAPQVELVQTNDVPTDTVKAQIWLPEIQKNWPVLVRAGIWRSRPRPDGRIDVEFTVTDDRKLCDFRHNIFSCDMYGFNLDGCTGIAADGRVSFNAEGMRHSGQFVSPTEFEGEWRFVTPRCYDEGSWRASLME